MPDTDDKAYVVVWQKCYFGNVDGEQPIWVCRKHAEAESVARFLAMTNPELHTIEKDSPRQVRFVTRPAEPVEIAGCACLVKRLREQHPMEDDDALKLSRHVLDNHAILGIELLQDGYIATFQSPPRVSRAGVSKSVGWQQLAQTMGIIAVNTSHLPRISEATQGTERNTSGWAGENGKGNGFSRNHCEVNHSADFTTVNWYGTEYTFAHGVQSSAVRALWEEWEQTGLGLHQDTIRVAVDANRDTFRMDKAFRNHPSLGTMIQSVGDGKYRLAAPDDANTDGEQKK